MLEAAKSATSPSLAAFSQVLFANPKSKLRVPPQSVSTARNDQHQRNLGFLSRFDT